MSSRYDRIATRHFVTSDDIRTVHERGERRLGVCDNSTVTDEARELAMKLGIRLDLPGAPAPAAAAPSPAPAAAAHAAATPRHAAPAAPAMKTLPEDTGRRVGDAIAAVLAELQLGAHAATLAPVLTRRVFAALARGPEGK